MRMYKEMMRKKGSVNMPISDTIAAIIEEMLDGGGGTAELKRNDLATRVGCVPSQINYVITSRFSPDKGYIIESRRGGGGYIRITRKQMSRNGYLMHVFHAVGNEIDRASCDAFAVNLRERGVITPREANLIHIASGFIEKNSDRADMLRQIILAVMD